MPSDLSGGAGQAHLTAQLNINNLFDSFVKQNSQTA